MLREVIIGALLFLLAIAISAFTVRAVYGTYTLYEEEEFHCGA